MRRFFLFFVLILFGMSWPGVLARAQALATPGPGTATPTGTATLEPGLPALSLIFPAKGETLRGEIPISAKVTLPGFTYWELAFAYAENPTDTWFPLARGDQPINGEIWRWNTAAIADGEYALRLQVFFAEDVQEMRVNGLRVRNYTVDTPTASPSPTFTRTPARTLPPRQPTASPAPSLTPFPVSTPLPPNPASLASVSIWAEFVRGALITAALFLVFGWLLKVKADFNNRF